MPEKPKAESPSTATTGWPVSTAAAMAVPIPIPITPQVPTSNRLRGLCMSITERAKSSVLAPSLTRIASGWSAMIVFSRPNAPWKSIGTLLFCSLGAIFATFAATLVRTAPSQSSDGFCQSSMPASRSVRQLSISPTRGASMG